MQGKVIDFDSLRLSNELTPAVGNMKVNARGDQIRPNGEIVKTRDEIAEEKNKEALMYFRTVSLRKSLAQDDIDGVSYLYPVAGDACGFLGTTQEDQGPPIGPQILLSFLLCFVFVELHQRSKTRTTL